MNLYLISQNTVDGYDTYDALVVSAESESDAATINPSEFVTHVTNGKWMGTYSGGPETGSEYEYQAEDWVNYSEIKHIKVEYLGKTTRERGVVLASFNAG